jgi:NitT/TauT family transport system ATP-binding protein
MTATVSIEASASGQRDARAPGRPPKLVVNHVTKIFKAKHKTTLAVDDVSLHLYDGELVCLLGASGCGKSTLISIVGGLEEATKGEVRIEGDLVVGPGRDRGMVFQGYSLFPWMTVSRNIGYGLELAKWPKEARDSRVHELLDVMALGDFAHSLPKELSGGMRQRVAIARALAPEPDVLLLDEPFGALDAITKRRMQDFLHTVWQRTEATILMITHDVDEAVYLSNRIYVMAPHPGHITDEVSVPFGNARDASIKRAAAFTDLVHDLSDLLI